MTIEEKIKATIGKVWDNLGTSGAIAYNLFIYTAAILFGVVSLSYIAISVLLVFIVATHAMGQGDPEFIIRLFIRVSGIFLELALIWIVSGGILLAEEITQYFERDR